MYTFESSYYPQFDQRRLKDYSQQAGSDFGCKITIYMFIKFKRFSKIEVPFECWNTRGGAYRFSVDLSNRLAKVILEKHGFFYFKNSSVSWWFSHLFSI